jgi:ribosomal protein L29
MAQTLADIAPDDIIWGDSAAVQPPANNDWLTSAPRVALHDVDPADIDWWEMGRWRDRTLMESAQKTIGEAGNAVKRGLALSRLASEMEQPEPNPAKIIEIQREIAQNPPSSEFKTVMDDNASPQESWSAFTRNPVGVVNELMLDSLSSYASQMFEKAPARVAIGTGAGVAIGTPAFGVGAIPAGATGALAGFAQSGGAASYSLEMAGGILESLEKAGVNMGSPEELGAALQDEQRMQVAREFAQKKAIPVAAFDTVSALIAGRVMGAKPATVLQKLGRGMVETAVQSVLGMSGEAAGQLSQSGEITSVRQIGAEGIGEIYPGMIEVGVGTGVQAMQGQQPAASAPAARHPNPHPSPRRPPLRRWWWKRLLATRPRLPLNLLPLPPQPLTRAKALRLSKSRVRRL